ncbi:MAG: hypothetical protein Roseis2KO_21080 [Roseivirga sp.]
MYFDELRINHKKGHILQEDHYYPFGLSINALSSSAALSKPNRFKYNGFEKQTEFDLNWYDYSARQYDPQTGRFTSVDPAADLMTRHSPYNYAFDNPLRFTDPDGMMPDDVVEDGSSKPSWEDELAREMRIARNKQMLIDAFGGCATCDQDTDQDQGTSNRFTAEQLAKHNIRPLDTKSNNYGNDLIEMLGRIRNLLAENEDHLVSSKQFSKGIFTGNSFNSVSVLRTVLGFEGVNLQIDVRTAGSSNEPNYEDRLINHISASDKAGIGYKVVLKRNFAGKIVRGKTEIEYRIEMGPVSLTYNGVIYSQKSIDNMNQWASDVIAIMNGKKTIKEVKKQIK